jgi:hypothetical protein
VAGKHRPKASHAQLLVELRDMQPAELKAWARQNTAQLSMQFLLWLAEEEADASGADKATLNTLCGQLVVLREGLGELFLHVKLLLAASVSVRHPVILPRHSVRGIPLTLSLPLCVSRAGAPRGPAAAARAAN